ncbi:MAG: terminase small subunit [Alphaproteobacteria bacterium]|nr:terminase small subunit [Alphaproteobacteria bacterium]
MSKLTAKQARFVDEYLVDLNATQAAIRAGYSAQQARSIGHQNLLKPAIAEAIAAAQAARAQRTAIDADWVLRRLADEAVADLADILTENGAVKPVKDWPPIWRQGLVAGLDVAENTVEGVKVGQTVKVKLSDRIKRIELIGKHVNVQAFREKVDISNPDGSLAPKVIDASKLSTEALRELAGVLNGQTADPDGS